MSHYRTVFIAAIVMIGCLPVAFCAQPAVPSGNFALPEEGRSMAGRLCGVMPPGNTPSANLTNATFPIGTYVIPFDSHQNDIVKAFGFIHSMLRNATLINRIIEPPDVTLYTQANPGGAIYTGGPILVTTVYAARVALTKSAFPTVTVDQLTAEASSSAVYKVATPTRILDIAGRYGQTHLLLKDMGIPCDVIGYWNFNDPTVIHNYNLVIDDCGSWAPSGTLPAEVAAEFEKFVNDGNELIFTDIALLDFEVCAWKNKVTSMDSPYSTAQPVDFHVYPDFPAQYGGKPQVKVYQMGMGQIATDPVDPDVYVLADRMYDNSTRTIFALYFYWGPNNGIVEFFAYHPNEQTYSHTGDADSYKLAAILYGNKFLHTSPLDFGVVATNDNQPRTIAQQGTGPTQESERTTVTLTVRSAGGDITSANQLKVYFETMHYMNYVANSFVDEFGSPRSPDAINSYPNGSAQFVWGITDLLNGQAWEVSFKLTTSQLGYVYINAAKRSNITYIDFDGKVKQGLVFPRRVTVTIGGVPELPIGLTAVAALATIAIAATSAASRKRRECA